MPFVTIGADPKDIKAVTDEMATGNDRSVAVVGAALVDAMLTDSLRHYLLPDKEIVDSLIEPGNPCGDLAVKAKLGYLLGIYRLEVYKDLRTLCRIRNKFAHEMKVYSFADQAIIDLVRNLKICERYTTDDRSADPLPWDTGEAKSDLQWWQAAQALDITKPRERYLRTVQMLLGGLAYVYADLVRPQPVF